MKSPFVGKHSKKFPNGVEVNESGQQVTIDHTLDIQFFLDLLFPPPVWYVRKCMRSGRVDLHWGEAL